jgi:NlpC/P60 family putative phage cell wall peptidase
VNGYAVVAEALTWVGTPYQHQASTKGLATDCIGLIVGVARALGIKEASAYDAAGDVRGYGRQPDPVALLAAADRYLQRIDMREAGAGDIYLIRFELDPMHFAIISEVNPIYIIHALAPRGKVVEHRVDAVWRARIMRAYRYRDGG